IAAAVPARAPTRAHPWTEVEEVTVRAGDGERLAGWFAPAPGGAAVVLLPGAGSSRDAVVDHLAVLHEGGFAVLALDPRGHGRSTGRGMDWGWYGEADIAAAVTYLAGRADVDAGRIAVVGLSMGGEQAIGAAGADERIRAVVAEGGHRPAGAGPALALGRPRPARGPDRGAAPRDDSGRRRAQPGECATHLAQRCRGRGTPPGAARRRGDRAGRAARRRRHPACRPGQRHGVDRARCGPHRRAAHRPGDVDAHRSRLPRRRHGRSRAFRPVTEPTRRRTVVTTGKEGSAMTHTWKVSVDLFSSDDVGSEEHVTAAHAVLTTTAGNRLEGFGRARLNPTDRDVPEIGEELAAARALRDLADRLLRATSDDISQIEHQKVRLAR